MELKRWVAGWREVWRADRRWLLLRLACALIWAGELFWIQHLPFAVPPYIKYPLLVQAGRFFLDLIFAAVLLLLCKRRYLWPLMGLNLLVMTIIGTYVIHFHRPLMLARTYYEWREGWSLLRQWHDLLSWRIAGVLLAGFGLKIALLLRSGRYSGPPFVRKQFALVALLLYAIPVLGLQKTQLRLSLHPNGGMGRIVFAYGYTLPWFYDILANRGIEQHELRAKEFLARTYDRITPLEPPLRIPGHLVMLQLESVGGAAVDASYGGSLIMPFLHDLRDRSMSFRILSFHSNGSCDMDFAATTFTEPYPGVVPYRLKGIRYTNSTPEFMKRFGFKTYLFHGNVALYYDRGLVIDQLGFDHVLFKEQLAEKHLASSIAGIRDAEVFHCLLEALQTEQRAYVFAITLDTHVPFKQLTPNEMEVFPQPEDSVQRYFNSLRYLDNCLRAFIAKLPDRTTVVMYGDHTASLRSDYFESDVVNGKEYVPCLIYQKGSDLASVQQTREQPIATDGMLNLLDVMSYVRNSVQSSPWAAASSQPNHPSP